MENEVGVIGRQRGFSAIHIILAVLLVMVLAGVGYYVWKSNQDEGPKNKAVQINSFEECKNAGNPIMESYPEQCSANGKTFSNPNQSVTPPAQDTPASQTDNQLITEAIKEDCVKSGATDAGAAVMIVTQNMQDPNLYKKDVNFARLSAGCSSEGGGFRVFLQKKEGTWVVIGKSQLETIGCKALDGTGIPATVATTCYEEGGMERAIQ